MKKLSAGIFLFLVMGLFYVTSAFAEEVEFGGVHFKVPQETRIVDVKTFTGSTPSRAWVLEHGGEEVVAGSIVTEGVKGGLDSFSTTVLVKLYVEAFAVSWGARVTGNLEGELAVYCGGGAGYHLEATFGNEVYDYYGCMNVRDDKGLAATLVTWIKRGDGVQDPEGASLVEATRRLKPYLEGIFIEPYQPM